MSKETIKQIVTVTEDRVNEMILRKQIDIPLNYSARNALRSAQLELESKPSLLECDPNSIKKALFKMIVLGLNPAKNQIYFIPKKGKLILYPSYFGDMALVKRFCGAKEIINTVVYENDEYEILPMKFGKHRIPLHRTTIENQDGAIRGAYSVIKFHDNKYSEDNYYVEIMSIKQIEKSWQKSDALKYKKEGNITTHDEYPEEMAKRTVCRKACKTWLNSSSDYIYLEKNIINEEIDTGIYSINETKPFIESHNVNKQIPEETDNSIEMETEQQLSEDKKDNFFDGYSD